MAEKAREYNIPFIYFSTDYVFDGKKKGAYIEKDSTNPLGIYGKSKVAGEDAIKKVGGNFFIFRTSWVYSNIGHNFYLNIKYLAKKLDELKVVKDQFGVPTTSNFIANQIQKIIPKLNQTNSGIYHLVPNGFSSRYEFAKAIIKKTYPNFQSSKIIPIYSKDYPTKAPRPLNSILDNKNFQRAFMLKFGIWESELNKL